MASQNTEAAPSGVQLLQAAAYALAEAISVVATDTATQDQIDTALDDVEHAGHALVGATERELAAQNQQSEAKDRLIESLVGTPHPQTQKPFSLSSAEEYAKSLPEYRAMIAATNKAIVDKVAAEQALAVAKLRARVALARLERGA